MTKIKVSSLRTVVMRELVLAVKPRRGGGRSYIKRGLSARLVGPGIYKIHRQDGGSSHCVQVEVLFMEPWRSETVLTRVTSCREHGLGCYGLSEDCSLRMIVTKSPRWVALCIFVDTTYFKVVVKETPPMRKSKKGRPVTASEVGFFVRHLSRAR